MRNGSRLCQLHWIRWAIARSGGSAVECRPADVIPAPLVVKHQRADRLRQLGALPLALAPPGTLCLSLRRRRTHRLDRIGRGPELVGGDVGHEGRLGSGVRGKPGCPTQRPRGGIGGATHRPGLHHLRLTARPGPRLLDCPPGSRIGRRDRLEKRQHVLGAPGCPQGEETVVRIGERASAPDRDEARVTYFGENHSGTCNFPFRAATCVLVTSPSG